MPRASTGIFGFVPTVSGNRIDLTQIQAQSARYFRPTSASQPGHLKLYAGQDGQGAELATLDMELIAAGNLGPLGFDQQTLSTSDFALASDGHGGTLITYTPQNGIQLQQSLAAPIVATAGTVVSFASILQNAFGTSSPGFTSITLLASPPFPNTSVDTGYWSAPNITPTWLVNGIPITGPTQVTDISTVSLVVGNQIIDPASFQAVVTAPTSGPQSETITYSAWSVDPAIVNRLHSQGFGAIPTPDAVVASAHAFADLYGVIPNTSLCNWIGDNVAAGAGAPMPLPDALLDPTSNVAGGFWRVHYRGTNSSLITNWSGLVLPGDIVRMGWFKPETGAELGHTTTVLGAVGADGRITVYDNDGFITGPTGRQEVIDIHNANYWLGTDPADITIYRLDPNQQYLIEGTQLAELIQGSVFNDLIQPGGGADIITGGPGDNEIQDTTAHLNTVTVTDLNAGDTLDFTDLDPALAELSFTNGILTVGDGMHFAQLRLLGLTNPVFSSRSDGNGGTLVSVAGGFGDVHMMCFDGLAYDFQAVGDFVAVQSNDAGNPWQVQIRTASAPGATSITTGLAAMYRRCAHKLRRRPGQSRPCRRYRGCGAPCRRRAGLRRRHAGAAFRQRLSAQLEHGPVGHGHRPRQLSRLGGRPRLAGRPRLGQGPARQQQRLVNGFPAAGRHCPLPPQRRRDSRRLRRCLARGAGRFALGRQLARNNGARPGDVRRTGPGQRRPRFRRAASDCEFPIRWRYPGGFATALFLPRLTEESSMLLNALFPTRDIGTDPAKIRDWAQAAEDLGFHCIEVADHVFGAAPRGDWKPIYSEHDPFHETFTTMAFIAAVTKTIKLCSGVLILPQRQTGVVAKQAAEVDILSGGRLRLGVGVGWNHVEYEALGIEWKTRGARQAEQIEVMRRLWTEDLVTFSRQVPHPGRRQPAARAGAAPDPDLVRRIVGRRRQARRPHRRRLDADHVARSCRAEAGACCASTSSRSDAIPPASGSRAGCAWTSPTRKLWVARPPKAGSGSAPRW